MKGQLKDSNGQHFERNWHRPSTGTPSDSESEAELETFSAPSTPDIFDTSDDNIRTVARLGRDSDELFEEEGRHPAVKTLNSAISYAVFGMVTVVVSTFLIYKCIKKFLWSVELVEMEIIIWTIRLPQFSVVISEFGYLFSQV